jgi:hypothetical protein
MLNAFLDALVMSRTSVRARTRKRVRLNVKTSAEEHNNTFNNAKIQNFCLRF